MEGSSKKKTRAATCLQKQALNQLIKAKTHVDINPQTTRHMGQPVIIFLAIWEC